MLILTALAALSAFALELENGGLNTEDETPAFGELAAFLDEDFIDIVPGDESDTSLGDFVIVRQWDSLGDFVVVKQWDANLGDFVVVRQWDFTLGDFVVVKQWDTDLGDFVVVKQWDFKRRAFVTVGDRDANFDDYMRITIYDGMTDR